MQGRHGPKHLAQFKQGRHENKHMAQFIQGRHGPKHMAQLDKIDKYLNSWHKAHNLTFGPF